jgi:hypothetical protein
VLVTLVALLWLYIEAALLDDGAKPVSAIMLFSKGNGLLVVMPFVGMLLDMNGDIGADVADVGVVILG